MIQNADLARTIEVLYEVFSVYPRPDKVNGCPCCVSNEDQQALHSKKLKELENEDLSKYAFKAMTTWGGIVDFKYFLPRIFELSANNSLMVDNFIIFGKLEYGCFSEWTVKEKEAVRSFLKGWWNYYANTSSHFDSELLVLIHLILSNLNELLDEWNMDFKKQGFKNYLSFLENEYYLLKEGKGFKPLTALERTTFTKWIESHESVLMESFFYYDSVSSDFSRRISNALYTLEKLR